MPSLDAYKNFLNGRRRLQAVSTPKGRQQAEKEPFC